MLRNAKIPKEDLGIFASSGYLPGLIQVGDLGTTQQRNHQCSLPVDAIKQEIPTD